jgi:hypothetical protein
MNLFSFRAVRELSPSNKLERGTAHFALVPGGWGQVGDRWGQVNEFRLMDLSLTAGTGVPKTIGFREAFSIDLSPERGDSSKRLEKPPETSTLRAGLCSPHERPDPLILNQTAWAVHMGRIAAPKAICATCVPPTCHAACGHIRQDAYVFNHLAQGRPDHA